MKLRHLDIFSLLLRSWILPMPPIGCTCRIYQLFPAFSENHRITHHPDTGQLLALRQESEQAKRACRCGLGPAREAFATAPFEMFFGQFFVKIRAAPRRDNQKSNPQAFLILRHLRQSRRS
jgi:hypothetical protein